MTRNPIPRDPAVGASLRDTTYERIYQKITLGTWPMGTKLPSETELTEEFGVSRPVLREALMRLRIDGIIDTRQGAGTRVINTPSRTVLDHVPPGDIADVLRCYEFRVGLEGEAAHLATERAVRPRIAAIETAHQRMVLACDMPSVMGQDEDIAFHMAIARATENSYYVNAVGAIIQAIRTGVRIASTLPHWTREERLRNAVAEHGRLLAAIRAGDADTARTLMRRHIEEARARVFLGQRAR